MRSPAARPASMQGPRAYKLHFVMGRHIEIIAIYRRHRYHREFRGQQLRVVVVIKTRQHLRRTVVVRDEVIGIRRPATGECWRLVMPACHESLVIWLDENIKTKKKAPVRIRQIFPVLLSSFPELLQR